MWHTTLAVLQGKILIREEQVPKNERYLFFWLLYFTNSKISDVATINATLSTRLSTPATEDEITTLKAITDTSNYETRQEVYSDTTTGPSNTSVVTIRDKVTEKTEKRTEIQMNVSSNDQAILIKSNWPLIYIEAIIINYLFYI